MYRLSSSWFFAGRIVMIRNLLATMTFATVLGCGGEETEVSSSSTVHAVYVFGDQLCACRIAG